MCSYINELSYYRILKEFEDFQNKVLNIDNVIKIEVDYGGKFDNTSLPAIQIYFRSIFARNVRIVQIKPCRSSYPEFAEIELLNSDFESIPANAYDAKTYDEIEKLIMSCKNEIEKHFNVTMDIVSCYNLGSSYTFYKNNESIIIHCDDFLYKFIDDKIDIVYSYNNEKIEKIENNKDNSHIVGMYNNYMNYLAYDDVMVYENDIYINKDKFTQKVLKEEAMLFNGLSEGAMCLIAIYMGICVYPWLTGISFSLTNTLIYIGAVVLYPIFAYYLSRPYNAILDLSLIKQEYIPVNTKSYIIAKRRFKKFSYNDIEVSSLTPKGKPEGFTYPSFTSDSVEFINQVTHDDLIDYKINKVNNLLKKEDLPINKSILDNKILPDINMLADNYSMLGDKGKDNLLISLDSLERKLSNNETKSRQLTMELDSVSNVVKKQISEL